MNTLVHLFQTGGFMMYPLLLASIIAVAIAVERFRLYRLAQSDMALLKSQLPRLFSQHQFEDAQRLCEKAGGVAGELLATFLMNRSYISDARSSLELEAQQRASRLKERLNYLSAIVTLAPLLGLLGTVTGMIQAFDVLSISEGQPFAITAVAILAMVLYVMLEQRANNLITQIEETCGIFLVSEGKCKKDVVELATKIVEVQKTKPSSDDCPMSAVHS